VWRQDFLPFPSPSSLPYALSDGKHLSGFASFSVCRGMRRTFNKKAQKATHFMLLYERRRRKGKKGKEKCFYSFALFYDKYHCFVRENVSSHTPENIPLCHCHLNFFIISFCVLPLSRPPPARTVCDPKIVYEFLTRNGQGWKK
jgi:hypothetical protein